MNTTGGGSTPLEIAQAETRAAFENRALIYLNLYQTLAAELGPEQAIELMRSAIYDRGVEISEKYREAAEDGDLEEIGEIFCEGSPCGGALFEPGVEAVGTSRILLRMTACPLVETWREHGVPEYEIDVLCRIASAVDEGTFEGAGLDIEITERLGEPESERCLLDIRLR
ncbi:MAG: L-2-amino-thiazoline-4-carboxylic acid hydrolase [Coriobacteriia bacterium]